MLVLGEVFAEARYLGVHLGSAERLVVGFLAGCHLDQRRSCQKDLGLLLDHDVVVGEAGLVRAACGRVAEHHTHGRDPQLRQLDELVEEAAGLSEVGELRSAWDPRFLPLLGVHSQVAAGRFDEAHVGEPVVACDLDGTHPLLEGVGVEGAGQNSGVVAHDDALGACDDPNSGDHPAANGVVGFVRG